MCCAASSCCLLLLTKPNRLEYCIATVAVCRATIESPRALCQLAIAVPCLCPPVDMDVALVRAQASCRVAAMSKSKALSSLNDYVVSGIAIHLIAQCMHHYSDLPDT